MLHIPETDAICLAEILETTFHCSHNQTYSSQSLNSVINSEEHSGSEFCWVSCSYIHPSTISMREKCTPRVCKHLATVRALLQVYISHTRPKWRRNDQTEGGFLDCGPLWPLVMQAAAREEIPRIEGAGLYKHGKNRGLFVLRDILAVRLRSPALGTLDLADQNSETFKNMLTNTYQNNVLPKKDLLFKFIIDLWAIVPMTLNVSRH